MCDDLPRDLHALVQPPQKTSDPGKSTGGGDLILTVSLVSGLSPNSEGEKIGNDKKTLRKKNNSLISEKQNQIENLNDNLSFMSKQVTRRTAISTGAGLAA